MGDHARNMVTTVSRVVVGFVWLAIVLSTDNTAFATTYTCEEFPDFAAYLRQWEENHPLVARKMYPFGADYCDNLAETNEIISGFDPKIRFDLPFYGKVYKSLWISPSGFIALDENTPASQVTFVWVSGWPNPQYPVDGQRDPPLIAPFYSESDMYRPLDPSELSYRVLDPRYAGSSTRRLLIEGMLEELSLNIRGAVLGTDGFTATYGIMVTWYRVTFASNECTGNNDDCARNTYQAAVVTDGVDSFAVFSYYNMTWVGGGGPQHCDRRTGRRSSSAPNCRPGHIGFNAGEGRAFHALPTSGLDSIHEMDRYGGSNVTGRYYYKVAADSVVRGGCAKDTSLDGSRWPAEIYPKSGGMLGGTPVQISGPCFENPELVKCRYGDIQTEAVYFDNVMRVVCVAPIMSEVGTVKVGVSIDGDNFKFETDYIIVTQDHVKPAVRIEREVSDWMTPRQISLYWSPADLQTEDGGRVNIKLFGYREDTSSGTPQGQWRELKVLSEGYSNTGVYTFQSEDVSCDPNDDTRCKDFDIGAFQINVVYPTDDPSNPRRIWSRIFPLAWFIKTAMVQAQGAQWVQQKCDVWYYANDGNTAWINELEPCPCKLEQARADFGRYQPDPLCSQDSLEVDNCDRHVGATHCVLSTYASSSGSGNQCCYNSGGELMHSGDSMYGSRPQRSHVWGAPPYGVPPRVPKLSHWVSDVTGYYYCCLWHNSKAACHSKYLALRMTRDCQHYEVPGQAAVFGDPHFETFDDVFYTFNGYGEYWLMQVDGATIRGQNVNFKLQARLQQPDRQPWGVPSATYTTAVGMELNNQHTVVVAANQGGFNKKLMIHINDYQLDLTKDDLRRQEFNDFILINNDALDSDQVTNITVVYRCGLGVTVSWRDSFLDVLVSAPPEFKSVTRGLLGKYNDNSDDDLEPPSPGGPPFNPTETEKVHDLFGEKWRVSSAQSCFRYLYQGQMNYDFYNRPDFRPNFTPQFPSNNSGVSEDDVQRACGNNFGCTFDYKATLSESVGTGTKATSEWVEEKRLMAKKVYSCPWLPVPDSIKQEPVSYLVGSTVTLTGCVADHTLEGPTVYNCQSNGDGPGVWSPQVTSKCRGPDEPIATTTVLAIAIPAALVAVLIVIAIVVIVLVLRKKKKKKRHAQETKQAMADFMGGNADTYDTVSPSHPVKKPPRPELAARADDTLDIKTNFQNKLMDDTPTTGNSSGQHVSFDTLDGDTTSSTKPLKQSTLKSRTKSVNPPSPEPSPEPKKKPRPYQYPTQSRDNSLEDWHESPTLKIRGSQGGAPPVATYRPRDPHSYSNKGHNIPTSDENTSNYYKRKYGKYSYA